MRRIILSVVVSVLAVATVPAGAIVGGSLDGEQHPGVGLIYFRQDGDRYRCSGTLVTPTVVVTAAHCTERATDVLVTFDASAPRPPDAATNPGDPSRFIAGTAHADPRYSGGFGFDTLFDIGVVVLDRPATETWPGIPLTPLAPAGRADALRVGNGAAGPTTFTVVGYGIRFEHPTTGPAKPTAVSDRIRRSATEGLQLVKAETIKTIGVARSARSDGSTCFGDSGGALLLDGQLLGVTSWGASQFCIGTSGYQRTDSAAARDFLAAYLTLP